MTENLEPGFYKTNAWEIAKQYQALGDKTNYLAWKRKAEAMESKDVDDERSTKEMLAAR